MNIGKPWIIRLTAGCYDFCVKILNQVPLGPTRTPMESGGLPTSGSTVLFGVNSIGFVVFLGCPLRPKGATGGVLLVQFLGQSFFSSKYGYRHPTGYEVLPTASVTPLTRIFSSIFIPE